MGSVPSPPPEAHRTAAAPSQPPPSDHRIYASFCDDTNSNWVECYDPSINGFTHMGPIPGLGPNCVLKDFAMVSLGDSIYVIGGRVVRKERSSTTDHVEINDGADEFIEVDLEVRSSVLRYHVGRDRWAQCGPLRMPRCCFACCVCEGKIYVAGGKADVTCKHGVASGEVYDPALDEWSSLPSMSVLRYKCVGVTWQGKIYVIGGFASRGDHYSGKMIESFIVERSSAEVYDTRTGTWHMVVGMWQLDVPPNQIVAVNETLFSSGDCLKPWKGHIESYDGDMNMWNVMDESHLRTCSNLVERLYLTMAPIGSQLYFLGGYETLREPPRMLSRVHVFDTSATSREWTSFELIEEQGRKELCSHCCVVRISS